jgi:hypothetical protein
MQTRTWPTEIKRNRFVYKGIKEGIYSCNYKIAQSSDDVFKLNFQVPTFIIQLENHFSFTSTGSFKSIPVLL